MRPQEYVNHPSAGTRFITAWGADSRWFGVFDLEQSLDRLIGRLPGETDVSVLRPHISRDLLVWLEAEIPGDDPGEIRFTLLPSAGADRDRD